MKIPFLLLALAAATPALSQTPNVPAIANAPVMEAPAPDSWQFTPDFLRDQSRISWRLGPHIFSSTITGAGIIKSERTIFTGESGKIIAFSNAYFGKRGELQKQELLNGSMNSLEGTPDSIVGSTLSLQNVIDKAMLSRRVLTVSSPTNKRVLTINYDARARHASDVFAEENGKPLRTINYFYDARGLSQITDGATSFTIERDADGKMRALSAWKMSALKNGLLTRSATPIKDDKGAIIGTRIEDYNGGILREVNEWTREGGASNTRTSQTSSTSTTSGANGQQSTENKFEFRVNIDSGAPAVAAVENRKRTLYKNAKIASEELFRNGVLTHRSEFNDNGVVSKVTSFNADGSVASEIDTSKIPYADGGTGIIRR